jgi:hypothetical protein
VPLEPEPPQLIRGRLGRDAHFVGRVDERAVGRAGSVANPDAAALAHEGVQRHGDAARCRRADDLVVGVVIVQVGLAVRDDDQRSRRARLDLAHLGQAHAKDWRSDEFVDRNDGDEQHLQLPAPRREFGRDDRGEPKRDAGLRNQAGPCVGADARFDAGGFEAERQAEANQAHAQRHNRGCDEAHRRQRVEPKRGADGDEEHHQHRKGATLKRDLERVALRHREVFDDEPGGHRGEERLEALGRADLAEDRADANQHDSRLASDEAEIEGE